MNQILLALVAGSLLSLLTLAVGLLMGVRLARAADPRVLPVGPSLYIEAPAPQRSAGGSEIERLTAAWVDLRIRLSEVALRIRSIEQLPEGLASRWREELSRLTAKLHESLEQQANAVERPAAHAKREDAAASAPAAAEEIGHEELISNEQILELLSHIGQNVLDESAPLVRYRYAAKQFLAPAVNDGPLAAEAFHVVQCHDISVRDIRYFVDDAPTDARVVMGLGLPAPVKWVAAEIEDSRSAYRYGRVGYLVTARLLASIDNRKRAALAPADQSPIAPAV